MFFAKKYKVIIKNKNITIEAKSGSNLFKLLQEHNIGLPTLCSGNGQCGKCKVHISSDSILKPTKKERLILARMSLDDGYRLACQYIVKSDLIINTEVFNHNEEIVLIDNNPEENNPIEAYEDKDSTNGIIEDVEQIDKHEIVEKIEHEEKDVKEDQVKKPGEEDSITNPQPAGNKYVKKPVEESDDIFNPTDGLLLIQYARGIKYYMYSAGINNVSSEGFIKSDESIIDLIENNSICDFIYAYTEIRDIERVLIILDKKCFDKQVVLKLINYYSFYLGTLLCEIIQPEDKQADLLTFLRLVRVNNDKNNLIVHLDNLSNVFLTNDNTLINLNCSYVSEDIKLDKLMNPGDNPIISISDDLLKVEVADEFKQPTGVNFSVLLKVASQLEKMGIIDSNFKLKERSELLEKIPLDILVKISNRDGIHKFFIYRKNKIEISLTQQILDNLKLLKDFIKEIIVYIESNFGKIELISLDTILKFDNMSNELLNLGIIPNKFSNKLVHITGDPTIFATRLFQEKSLIDYINNNFLDYKEIELYKDLNFNKNKS
jgi:ferredoxin